MSSSIFSSFILFAFFFSQFTLRLYVFFQIYTRYKFKKTSLIFLLGVRGHPKNSNIYYNYIYVMYNHATLIPLMEPDIGKI